MILNAYSVIILFISFLIGIVSVLLAVVSLRSFYSESVSKLDFEGAQQREYLLLHLAQVILVVEALMWPFLYFTLHTFVPYIEGAMCIFGVTQSQPALSSIVQIYKTVVFFLIGWWLILNAIDKSTEESPLFRLKTISLFIISLFVVFDSIMTIYYITGFNIEVDVACCTTIFDLQERKTTALSKAIWGQTFQDKILPVYYISSVLYVLLLFLNYRLTKKGKASKLLMGGAFLYSILNAVLTVIAYFEVLAPLIMNLPEHHCIYCMWQYQPLSILSSFLFILATFSSGWALFVWLSARRSIPVDKVNRYLEKIYLFGFICIVISLIVQTVLII